MQIKLQNVRLSFPNLFKPKAINDGEPKYGAAFLLNKKDDAAQIDLVRTTMRKIAGEKFGGEAKIPKGIKACLHDGSEKDYDGYGDEVMFISASSSQRPTVVDRNRTPLTADDGRPYAGCYVNAVIRLWVQDNQFGKRVNAQLQGVQFVRDGEAFGEKPFNAEEEFEEIADSADHSESAASTGKDPF